MRSVCWASMCLKTTRRHFSTVPTSGVLLGANPCNFGIIENHWKTDTARYPDGDSYIQQVQQAGYEATDLVTPNTDKCIAKLMETLSSSPSAERLLLAGGCGISVCSAAGAVGTRGGGCLRGGVAE